MAQRTGEKKDSNNIQLANFQFKLINRHENNGAFAAEHLIDDDMRKGARNETRTIERWKTVLKLYNENLFFLSS